MTTSHYAAGQRSRRTLTGAIAYLTFVIYGSLVPLDFQPGSLSDAWPRFLETSYLNLGVADRADWVANILLYIPLAYLWCAAVANASDRAIGRMMRAAIVFVGCVIVAVSVEFAQLFFPPRTVSLNDLLAEAIGSALGVWGWLVLGDALRRLGAEIATGGRVAIRATLALYLLVYIAYSLFPYDFLVSSQELSAKLAGSSYALWLVPETCSRYAFCAAKLAVEALAIMPIGALLGPLLVRNRAPFATALIIGIVLGVAIEAVQMLIASGISEGASAVSRAAGMVAGLACYRTFDIRWIGGVRRYLGWIVLAAAPFYVAGLAWANRLVTHAWFGLDGATVRLRDTHLLPFYYHYYTTETLALQSLIATVAMYAPIGIGYWMWRERSRPGIPGSAVVPASVGAVLALTVETGKLFAPGTHPDPTNVLIAGIASATTYVLATTAHRWALEPASHASNALPAPEPAASQGEAASGWAVAGALILTLGAIAALWAYPIRVIYLASALALWALALWRWPAMGLPAAVALLPLLDFSDWTGWVVINEFDLFIAITLAVTLLRADGRQRARLLDGPAFFVLTLVAASFIASALVGLFPLSPVDGNALFSYMTGYSALRALKGPLWALLMLPLFAAAGAQWPRRLTGGIVAGLCAVTAVVLWQRIAFAGLFDTASDYRVEGTFPELRVGGGDIHAYLVMASPFIVAWAVRPLSVARFLLGTALLILASYALAVTFTRGGYVGLAGALAILAAFALWRSIRSGATRAAIVVAVGAMLASAIVVLPLMYGSFMRARVATSADEAAVRFSHWSRAIGMIDRSPRALLFGMGLGTFPRALLFKEPTLASASLSYERRNGETFARLGSGRPLYLEQAVDIEPRSHYQLSVEVRAPNGDAAIDVTLCEKTYQYSFQCKRLLAGSVTTTQWTRRDVDFDSADLGDRPPWRRRPILLAISNSGVATTVDVRNVRLWDAPGADRIANGDFARGGARWNFAADDHLPWHIFNVWVEILFEQGLFGIVTLSLLLYVAFGRMARRAVVGEWFSVALIAATTGFLLIGLSESLLDGPRIATFFFVLLVAALISHKDDKDPRPSVDRRPSGNGSPRNPTNGYFRR